MEPIRRSLNIIRAIAHLTAVGGIALLTGCDDNPLAGKIYNCEEVLISFDASGTGLIRGGGETTVFNWELLNENQLVLLKDPKGDRAMTFELIDGDILKIDFGDEPAVICKPS